MWREFGMARQTEGEEWVAGSAPGGSGWLPRGVAGRIELGLAKIWRKFGRWKR
jgi:hypothetical protein